MFTIPCVSRVTCHVSRVTCRVSCVTCHVSRVTCHMSHVIGFSSPSTLLSTGPTTSSFHPSLVQITAWLMLIISWTTQVFTSYKHVVNPWLVCLTFAFTGEILLNSTSATVFTSMSLFSTGHNLGLTVVGSTWLRLNCGGCLRCLYRAVSAMFHTVQTSQSPLESQ